MPRSVSSDSGLFVLMEKLDAVKNGSEINETLSSDHLERSSEMSGFRISM